MRTKFALVDDKTESKIIEVPTLPELKSLITGRVFIDDKFLSNTKLEIKENTIFKVKRIIHDKDDEGMLSILLLTIYED